ncbi:MAG: hypothetical protein J5606_03760 [Bacteroidales bacterium]|nr:hypothetical protein [Bacteroidales bacterium]
MKKFLFVLLSVFVVAFVFSSCKKNDKKQYIDYLLEDYQTVIKAYPAAEGHFVEAQYELNGLVSDLSTSKIKASKVKYIYYLGWNDTLKQTTMIYHERDFEKGTEPTLTVKQEKTPWLGDKWIANFDGFISLEKAIKTLKDAGYKAETKYITLRYPMTKFDYGHALYVFGGDPRRIDHYFVDPISGEIYVKE